jgi:hypothetical protein
MKPPLGTADTTAPRSILEGAIYRSGRMLHFVCIAHRATATGILLDNVRIKPVLRRSHDPVVFTGSKTFSMDSLLDPFGSDPGIRLCADRVGDLMRHHCQCIRL